MVTRSFAYRDTQRKICFLSVLCRMPYIRRMLSIRRMPYIRRMLSIRYLCVFSVILCVQTGIA